MKAERDTKQKQTIYRALVKLDHPSATEVYEDIHGEYPSVSRGTVFRVLKGFADTGRIRRLHFSGSDDRFDATVKPHSHLVCRICGKVTDFVFPVCYPDPVEGFEVESCEVELVGRCGDCIRKAN